MNILKKLRAAPNIFIRPKIIDVIAEKFDASIEVIPREITDIKIAFNRPALYIARLQNNTCGHKTLHYAVGDAKDVAFRLLTYVKPENLFFFFSERIELLNLAFMAFIARYGIVYKIPYFMEGCSCPKDTDDYYRGYKDQPDIWAIVLCKVINAEVFQHPLWAEQKKCSNYGDCYKIGWSELQKINKMFYDSIFCGHSV